MQHTPQQLNRQVIGKQRRAFPRKNKLRKATIFSPFHKKFLEHTRKNKKQQQQFATFPVLKLRVLLLLLLWFMPQNFGHIFFPVPACVWEIERFNGKGGRKICASDLFLPFLLPFWEKGSISKKLAVGRSAIGGIVRLLYLPLLPPTKNDGLLSPSQNAKEEKEEESFSLQDQMRRSFCSMSQPFPYPEKKNGIAPKFSNCIRETKVSTLIFFHIRTS